MAIAMRRYWWAVIGIGVLSGMLMLLVTTMPEAPPAEMPGDVASVVGYEIVREFPHDPTASTQGLLFRDGFLYESTGPTGASTLRKARLETGEVVVRRQLDARLFGEGLAEWEGRLLQLTPMRVDVTLPGALAKITDPESALKELGRKFGVNVGSVYDAESLEPITTFAYESEGWGLTRDDRRLILSDGSSALRFLDPSTFRELDRVEVADGGRRVPLLNELEFIDGEVYANTWQQDRIAIIDPTTGQVRRWIDLAGLEMKMSPVPDRTAGAVLNGIAYDAVGQRLFVTGKLWPRVFEIRPVEP
jgi:glutaminyl-peptide cyclotransferase